MAASKEPNMAFMPTSNDGLYSPLSSDTDMRRSYRPRSSNSPGNSTVLSHAATPSAGRTSREASIREMVPTTSMLPSSATDGPEPSDETFWYNLHLETLENFERERATWKKMADKLRRTIEQLREEIHNRNGPSPPYSMGGKENDKVFFDPGMINVANQKLREFSVMSNEQSPRNGPSSPAEPFADHVGDLGTIIGRKASGSMRLPSIIEDADLPQTHGRRVSYAKLDKALAKSLGKMDADGDEINIAIHEAPMSPPSTACPTSPPPPEHLANAGHTPARTSFHRTNSEPDRKVITDNLLQGKDKTLNLVEAGEHDQDYDPELASPKILPTTPTADSDMLSALSEKLQEVAANPEEHQPEVVKSIASAAMAEELGVEAPVDLAIPFKTKKSMNFGCQLGSRW